MRPARAHPLVSDPWCAAVSELTADSSDDQTGRSNTMSRVVKVKDAHVEQFRRCEGTMAVGISTAAFAAALHDAHSLPPGGPVADDDATHVLRLYVKELRYLPKTNPLYLDGVPVWFEAYSFHPL